MAPEQFDAMIAKLAAGTANAADIEALRLALTTNGLSALQLGKYNINISQGQNVQIGDSLYFPALNDEAMQAIAHHIVQKLQASPQPASSPTKSVDALVQQVRSRLHDDIQRLHGTMPLWGVDHWVPLGELFVDVNILEELSSSRRSELDDLWQDFNKNPSYRSLDRIGLGRDRQRVSGLEVLAKHTHLMVVGKPGSGKTTYLQRVVTECNAGNLQAHKIAVLIRLREFIEDGRDIGYSLERYLERCWQLAATETQLVLNQGRSLVLLDGLDEVTGDDGKTITKQIKQFARAYPQVQMAVTCRTQSQESRFERFDYVEVADFNEPQVRAFAEHWFQTVCADRGAGQAKAQVFLDQLFREENKPIRELAITPILLSLTCAVFEQKQAFYSKRSKLYEEGLELLLEQWDKSREIERDELYRDLSVERKLELLSYLAVKKFEQEQYVLFEQMELEGYIAEFLGIGLRESRAVLRAIESQHGLLIERSQKVWSFSHLTFQEYLVANWFCYLKRWQRLATCITVPLTVPRWLATLLLVLEMLPNADDLLMCMKFQIDNLIAKDEKLQRFLKWVEEKERSLIEVSRKPAAVRALCFSLDRGVSVDYYDYLCFCECDLAHTLGYNSDRSYPKLPNWKLLCVFARARDLNKDPEIADRCNGLENDFIGEFSIELRDTIRNVENSEFCCKLQVLYKQLPNMHVDNSRIFAQWWRDNGQSWTEQLRIAMIEHLNIGHDWQFDDAQKEHLQQYYEANLLLIACLNNNISHFNSYKDFLSGKSRGYSEKLATYPDVYCDFSQQVRQEIEETLLLPIAEIEKRKREKVE